MRHFLKYKDVWRSRAFVAWVKIVHKQVKIAHKLERMYKEAFDKIITSDTDA